eukprot:TRINITY_DN43324_c0_g1_i1.p1 TRINITY_DN43324_c0_g1~~TRINITY_DN43324_c0_g1_i1.p1  ORF type:complete len:1070 (-),score=184.39 TRINITY_DN43324_c0_g1_i1:18-3227(-)
MDEPVVSPQFEAGVFEAADSLAARLYRGEAHRATLSEAAALLRAVAEVRSHSKPSPHSDANDLTETVTDRTNASRSLDQATIRSWLRGQSVCGDGLRADALAAVEEALNVAQPRSSDTVMDVKRRPVAAEDLRRALMLGTVNSVGALVSRIRGCDPVQGRWINRCLLKSYLEERCASRWRWGSLALTLALASTLAVSASQHLRAHNSGELGLAIEASLGRPSSYAANLPESLLTWLATDSFTQHGVGLVGGIHVARLPETRAVKKEDVLCPYSITHFLGDFVSGGLSQSTRPRVCNGGASGGEMELGQPQWLRSHPATSEALEQAKAVFGEDSDTGFEIRFVGRFGPSLVGVVGGVATKVYAVASSALRIDASGLAEETLRVVSFDASPVWPADLVFLRDDDAWRIVALVVDAVLVVLMVCLALSRIVGLGIACRSMGCLTACCRFPFAWCVIDWCVVACGFMLISLYGFLDHLATGLGVLVSDLDTANCVSDDGCLDVVLEQSDRMASAISDVWAFFAIVMTCLWLRFVRYLQVSPDMAIMIRALAQASGELACLAMAAAPLLVFLWLAAHIGFGQRIEAFADAGTALVSVSLLCVGRSGLGVRAKLGAESGLAGLTWLWLFLATVAVVLLRLAFVVIVSAYLEVKVCYQQDKGALFQSDVMHVCLQEAARELAPPWPSLPRPPLELQRRREVCKAVQEFTERRLLRWLASENGEGALAPTPYISSQQLSEALGANTWGAQAWLDALLSSAGAIDAKEGALLGFDCDTVEADAFRIFDRLDASVQDLLERLRKMDSLIPSLTLGRGVNSLDDDDYEGDVGSAAEDDMSQTNRSTAVVAPLDIGGGSVVGATSGLMSTLAAASTSAAPAAVAAASSAVVSVSVSVVGAVAAASAAGVAAVEVVRNPQAAAVAVAGKAVAATAAAAAATAAVARTAVDVGAALADSATDLAEPVTSTLADISERARGAASSAAAVAGLGGSGVAAVVGLPHTTAPSDLQNYVERRLLELDQQDAARCAEFEATLSNLAQQLEAAEMELYTRNSDRALRFRNLEVGVEALIQKIAPLYDAL